jgi:CheY-like chemotaxis protein
MKELTVLVVEDNDPMMSIVVAMLDRFGFGTILTAKDGDEAFSVFQRNRPDLVITDWHMEGVDGVEFIQWIRRNKTSIHRRVPIILMKGYSDHYRIENARDSGVTEILAKPFSAHDLARRIMHVIDTPRDFIESLGFFGPDRRRRKNADFKGDDRRQVNPEEVL